MLIVSPLVWTAAPLGGIHQLQAFCRQAGVGASVLYSNLSYSTLIGSKLHQAIVMDDYALLGERLFAAAAFGLPPMGRRFERVMDPHWSPDHVHLLVENGLHGGRLEGVDWYGLERRTRDWLDALGRVIADAQFPIVGCSTTHGGLAPAVALLNVVKDLAPSVVTILGGSLCEGEMADGILSLGSTIDYIFSGEGDLDVSPLVKRLLEGDRPQEKIHYGTMSLELDNAPIPDYDDFYLQKCQSDPISSPTPMGMDELAIPYETSRGCWYARCTFCGLMGEQNRYRKKSPVRITGDLKRLVDKYGDNGRLSVLMTDNIIPPSYFDCLFPRIEEELSSLRLLYEVKANLDFRQLETLKRAGVTVIQPGIESLSDSLLRRMDKGVTVRENIALLRYARSLSIDIKWNLMYGVPGDKEEEYQEMSRLLPLIHHLQPPHLLIPLRLCRYSHYHRSPESFGISNFRPAGAHRDVLPTYADVEKLAILFSGDFPAASLENPNLVQELYKEFRVWREKWDFYSSIPIESLLPTLSISTGNMPGDYILTDTRGLGGLPITTVLDRRQAAAVLAPCPLDGSPLQTWALEAKIAVGSDSWFIPLVTASPSILLDKWLDFPA